MRWQVRHETRYRYAEPVHHGVQSLRLTPRREPRQRAIAWSIAAPGRRTEQVDAHGNLAHLLTLDEPRKEISIVVSGVVEVEDEEMPLGHEGPLSPLAYLAATPLTTADEEVRTLVRRCPPKTSDTMARLERLAALVEEAVRPGPDEDDRATLTPAAAVVARGVGTSRDRTHVLIACCRALGIPARYVSGYRLPRGSASVAGHAWADVWLGGDARWLAIDVDTDGPARAGRCRLAVGRDFLDAAPVRSVRQGAAVETHCIRVAIAAAAQQ